MIFFVGSCKQLLRVWIRPSHRVFKSRLWEQFQSTAHTSHQPIVHTFYSRSLAAWSMDCSVSWCNSQPMLLHSASRRYALCSRYCSVL